MYLRICPQFMCMQLWIYVMLLFVYAAIINGLSFPVGRTPVVRWDFNGASLDQGLFFDSLVLQKHSAQLVDVSVTHDPAHYYSLRSNKDTLACCKVGSLQHT